MLDAYVGENMEEVSLIITNNKFLNPSASSDRDRHFSLRTWKHVSFLSRWICAGMVLHYSFHYKWKWTTFSWAASTSKLLCEVDEYVR